MDQGIAIVGMACRYAGARSPAELWENVLAGRREFRRIPPERLRVEDYLLGNPADSLYAGEAAVLSGWELDRVHFRVAGSTYRVTDLAHWLALEVATEALADAGFPEAEGLPRDATGVLVGNSLTGETSRAQLVRLRWPYVRRTVAAALLREGWDGGRLAGFLAELEERYKSPFPEPNEESLAGGLSNTIAGRICNQLDLHGGGYTVDGACASSLLAVANACSSLAAGDLDVALAGGVDISLDPFELVGFARTGALTPGEMRVYDARSQGFVPGEGSGFVVLMREGEAVRRGCRIHAVIRGWGISSDGHGGISRPEAAGQRLALARAYRRAGFGPETVGYFEGHGTGTAVGDAAELEALSTALAEARREELPPALRTPVGSIKANIGHTKAAAGVAGLIKATLALAAQVLPPNTGCTEPHPILRRPGSPLRVLEQGEVWPAERPLHAAVSAMGFGGINAHIVLAGGDGAGRPRRRALSARERMLVASAQDAELWVLAAPDAASLAARVERLAELAPRLSRSELTDLAAELARRLEPGPVRAALVAATPGELAARLDRLRAALAAGEEARIEPGKGLFLSAGARPRRIGLLFPGQGSPSHLGRGGALARRIEGLDEIHALADLSPDADPQNTGVAQPAIMAHSLAGLEALERLGVRAAVAVGHSLGEIAALRWAGGLTREEALAIARARGQAMAALDGGSMASVAAPSETVGELLAGTGAVIAALNGPARTVVSGEPAAVEAVLTRAAARGLSTTRLRVSHAFHSPLVAAAEPELAAALETVPQRPLMRAVVSSVTGALLEPTADLRAILRRQVTAPVRFAEALAAARDRADLWIEVGPGHALTDLAGEILGPAVPILPLDAGSPSLAGLLEVAGALFVLGGPVDLESLFAGRFSRPFDPERPLRFLANPCEQAPVDSGAGERMESDGLDGSVGSVSSVRDLPTPGSEAPLDVFRHLVAARTELPVAAVREDSRLLSDLHLNSISVGQLVAEAARRLGLQPPASPTDYAQATVAEVARSLEEQMRCAPAGEETDAVPAGVDAWVRPFSVAWLERPLPRRTAGPADAGSWQVFAPEDHPLRAALESVPGSGVALCLPPQPDESHAGLFLAAAQAVLATSAKRFVVVQQGGGGGGFARTLHLELPDVATCVVDLPFDLPDAADRVAAEARAAQGYTEARYDADGARRVPVLRLLEPAPAGPLPLGADDVLLVTGGGKGIGAECALDLAKATGARLALLGRSAPEADAELAANLERMRAAGVTAFYAAADVTDAGAVRAAVDRVQSALGPVTAVLHAAGTNEPRLLASLDEGAFRRTLAPKVRGLDNVLAAVDPGRLRLLVAFGSIIGRAGLKGEADYATANEWLALRVDRFAREHPGCRGLTLEWSVWAGVGMGERLGTLEQLARQGIAPIPPDAGVAALRELLARSLPETSVGPDTAVVVAGRFGDPPTVTLERPELPLLRYLEKPRIFIPGVELVVDTEVSADTDPHLADHVLHGEPLFAAVFGLEAMVQTAQAVLGRGQRDLPQLEAVELRRPVVVPPGRSTTLRVAALVREPGVVEVAVRDASTGFQADHFRAVCRFAEPVSAAPRLAGFPLAPLVALDPADLYGGILFHAGRFRRLHEYRHLRATECLAGISPDGETAWFGRWLPGELVLGDPGARDAAIHGIQACIPHRTLLPTGVDRIVTGRLGSREALSFAAREVSRNGDDFVYDLEILGPDGTLRERWEGLRLRAVDRTPAPPAWSAALLGPWIERRLQEILPAAGVRISLEKTERRESAPTVERLLGGPVRHRPDGRPEAETGEVSVAHAEGLVLAVTRDGRIGCDLEPVDERSPEVWLDLLGEERFRLAELIAREHGETPGAAATRVWSALESLRKAGAPQAAPLILESATDDGWLLLRSGALRVATLLAQVRELSGPAALAVLVES